jgi:hypothetical protein
MDAFNKCKCKDIGPGGLGCPCCSVFHGTKRRKKLNRLARHRLSQEDEKQYKINQGNNL